MPPLPSDLRKALENAVIAARDEAVAAAGAALKRLAIEAKDFPSYLSPDERALRLRLRAAARQVGDPWNADKQAFDSLTKLTHEVAYEHWHRMLFARFLAENNLLIHPEHGVSVDLATVAELAQDEAGKTGALADTWALAGRFAATMLPQIFRPDDPALAVQLAPERQQALERILESLPPQVFTADDSLGWVYQFWQSAEKERVNAGVKGGDKITGETLPAVTQLFTEHYMVLFLLHNTIGAWHAAKRMATWSKGQMAKCQSEADCRAAVALPGYSFDYLRFVKDDATGAEGGWRPAAGAFAGWPKSAKELKVLDPCCGSGHFLVATLELLTHLRMAEEGLDAASASMAVIEDNLFGLELDHRCTQIAAFNVAFAAWKVGGEHRVIPEMHIACSGLGPAASLDQWLKLADKDAKSWAGPPPIPPHARGAVTNGLAGLHQLFSQAPDLGSLIDPRQLAGPIMADWETMQPFLKSALAQEKDDDALERAVAAQGMAKAAEILSGDYTLVITNVPYLGRGGQGDVLKTFAEKEYPEAKADLATVFVARMLKWVGGGGADAHAGGGGTIAAVTPQNWLFLTSYKKLRERLLKERTWDMVARLGPGAFETIGGHVVNVALLTISGGRPAKEPPHIMAGIDVAACRTPAEKAALLKGDLSLTTPPSLPAAAHRAGPGHGPASLQTVRSLFQGNGNTLQADGNPLQPTRSTLQPTGNTLQTSRSMLQTDRSTLRATGNTLQADRNTAEPLHGAPGRSPEGQPASPEGQSAAHGAQPAAHGGESAPRAGHAAPSAEESTRSHPAAPRPAAPGLDAEPAEMEDGPDADPSALPAEDGAEAASADGSVKLVPQAEQLKNPDARVMFGKRVAGEPMKEHAFPSEGLSTGDGERFVHCYWEQAAISEPWCLFQTAPEADGDFGGMTLALRWDDDGRVLSASDGARVQGDSAWGKPGVLIARVSSMRVCHYSGQKFEKSCVTLTPLKTDELAAIWAFASSASFVPAVRRLDTKPYVTTAVFGNLPFDLAHWQKVAAEKYPHGLPEPQSDDPTQWLFHGHPAGRVPLTPPPPAQSPHLAPPLSTVLQVAVARLAGYRWPAELDAKMRLAPEARAWVEKSKDLESHADDDGVVPLVNINKEKPGAERVRALLEAAFGAAWTPGLLNDLLAAAGATGKSLDEWVKHEFFAQHCALFHQRPFVWQIWDGKKDGFNILVHYHRLAEGDGKGKKLLEKIVYTYLGDWITQQQAAAKRGEVGADLRLKAAQDLQKKLEAIIKGDPPFDIFVRWKPLHEQPIGWNPDINDGVRMNIRPFVTAGVLRGKVNVKWTKDRGKEPESIRPKKDFPWFWDCDEDNAPQDFMGGEKFTGERLNDLHYTREVKDEARAASGSRG